MKRKEHELVKTEQQLRQLIGHPNVVGAGAAAGTALALASRRAALGRVEILADGCNCGWWWCGGGPRVRSWAELGYAVSALSRAKVDPWSAGVVEVAEWYRKAQIAAKEFPDVDRLRSAIAGAGVTGIAAQHRKRFLAALDPEWFIGATAKKAWRPGHRGEQEKSEITVALNTARELGWARNTPNVATAIVLLTGVRSLGRKKNGEAETFHSVAKAFEGADGLRKRAARLRDRRRTA